jgi:hypothetical protein
VTGESGVILSDEVEELPVVARVRDEEARIWVRALPREMTGRRADRDMLIGLLVCMLVLDA